jgi:hypothetical protein
MDIQDQVISLAAAAAGKIPALRSTRDSGRYADRVRVAAPQGSIFNGRTGVVVRVTDDIVYVRFESRLVLPFSPGELAVIS